MVNCIKASLLSIIIYTVKLLLSLLIVAWKALITFQPFVILHKSKKLLQPEPKCGKDWPIFQDGSPINFHLYLKLENTQKMGSFKLRGIANQMEVAARNGGKDTQLVTMSAGNYGRSFAFALSMLGIKGTVFMPETAPKAREVLINELGADVKRVPSAKLMDGVTQVG